MNISATQEKPKNILVKFYTFTAIASTLLELYGITNALHTFTWRFVFVLMFILFATITAFRTGVCISSVTKAFVPVYVIVVVSLFGNMFLGNEGFELRFIRFFIYLWFSTAFASSYFDGDYAYKIYKVIVWTATVVLLIQVFSANFLGRAFVGHLSFLPLRSNIYKYANYMQRYYSIFEEPGYYGMYVGPYVILQFASKKINVFEIGIIFLALLLSTSTSNLAVLAFLLLIFVILIKNDSIRPMKLFFIKAAIIIAAILAVYLFMQTPQYAFVMKRLENGVSMASRTSGYLDFSSFMSGNFFNLLFGNAMEAYPISGYATMVITFGFIGSIAYIGALLYLLMKTNKIGKYLVLFFFFINIGNVEFLGNASTLLIIIPYSIWYIDRENEQIV